MSETVISIDKLCKSYWIKHQLQGGRRQGEPYERFSEVLARAISTPFRRRKAEEAAASREEFWALKDVSFEVKRGEVLGIIGRNGAGKSTLLKVLSRITEPTSGRIEIDGRVASLLEVGTGFHPELTGRENVFLNGAILGMSRVEIKRKFDEIVAFAEVEKFLDTPVKRYSSGMYVRLAFAVAAHLEPEILIVDEVLAVGDAQFQKKCLGKMQAISTSEGRTVLFVSHNMESVMRLCSRAILLVDGKIHTNGSVRVAIENNFQFMNEYARIVSFKEMPRSTNLRGTATIIQAKDLSSDSKPWSYPFGRELKFSLEICLKKPLETWQLGIGLFSSNGMEIASWQNLAIESKNFSSFGHYRTEITYKGFHLVPGTYCFGIGIRSNQGMEDYLSECIHFEVVNSEISARLGVDTFQGRIVPQVEFNIQSIQQ